MNVPPAQQQSPSSLTPQPASLNGSGFRPRASSAPSVLFGLEPASPDGPARALLAGGLADPRMPQGSPASRQNARPASRQSAGPASSRESVLSSLLEEVEVHFIPFDGRRAENTPPPQGQISTDV